MHLSHGLVGSLLLLVACVGDSPGNATDAGTDAAPPDAGADASPAPDGGDAGIDTQSDPNNCGAIGHVCASSKCSGGDCVRRVFVTSGTSKGTFGGASGADTLCKNSALGPGLPGTFFAWISTSSSTPLTHFTKGTAPYVLIDGKTVVANSFAELAGTAKSPLARAIDMDEFGNTQTNVNVWTATHPDGTAIVPNCSDFVPNPNDANATVGSSSTMNTTWTEATTLPCTTFAHLYCVEQ